MCSYINANLPTSSFSPYTPGTTTIIPGIQSASYLYTFGSSYVETTGAAQGEYLFPALQQDTYSSKFIFSQFNDLLIQYIPTGEPNPHVYKSFQLVIGGRALDYLKLIGFILNKRNVKLDTNGQFNNTSFPIKINCSYEVDIGGYTNPGTAAVYDVYYYTCSVTDPLAQQLVVDNINYFGGPQANIFGPYVPNMQLVQSLYFNLLEFNSEVRAPFNQLTKSNVIARIPVFAQYGEMIDYEVQNWVPAPNLNFKANVFTIRVTDSYGDPVDFQGVNWECVFVIQFATNVNNIPPQLTGTLPSTLPGNSNFTNKMETSGIKPSTSLLQSNAPGGLKRPRI
jgi:hypothetical protein